MDYVKLNRSQIIQGVLAVLLGIFALMGAAALSGCAGNENNNEDIIRDSLSSELDSIKNIDDSFVNDFSESINMSQLSMYGIDGVEFMKAYLDGFDYTIDNITVDGDQATAQITLTCKSYTGYTQALQAAVDEIKANPDSISAMQSDSEINDVIGDIVIDSLNNVDLATTEPITITYTRVDDTWEPASSTSGDIAAALMTN